MLWKLDGSGQNFLPRLGGALATIRPCGADPSKYLVCQTDNTLRVVSVSSMSVLSSVFGVKPAPAGLSPRGAAAATLLQPGSGYLLLPSENGEMQVCVGDAGVGGVCMRHRDGAGCAEMAAVQTWWHTR